MILVDDCVKDAWGIGKDGYGISDEAIGYAKEGWDLKSTSEGCDL